MGGMEERSPPPELAETVARVCARIPGVTYVLLFGSVAQGKDHRRSDVDLAVGGDLGRRDLLALEGHLEDALGRPTQVVGVAGAPVGLRYRIFRDGIALFEREHRARVRDQARTVVEYEDYRFLEEACTRGVFRRQGIGGGDG